MKVALLIIFTFSVVIMSLMGSMPHGYVHVDGLDYYYYQHNGVIWIISIILGAGLSYWSYDVMKDRFEDQNGKWRLKIITTVLGILFFYAQRQPLIALYNRSGITKTYMLHGIVMNKRILENRRRTNHFYYVSISDTISTKNFYFAVSDYVFHTVKIGDQVNKEFYRGKLGILFRMENE